MAGIASMLPSGLKESLKRIKDVAGTLAYYGTARYCPVCGRSSRRFRGAGIPVREDAQCVHCGSLERHRLLWKFINDRTDLFNGSPKRVLHIAPETCFASRFRERLGESYVTADLLNPRAMVKMDITDIHFPDQSFDVIYCSHVLEHVPDDRKAMREFHRVLKNKGWAILLVPITASVTFEDPTIVDPEEREKAFGQSDHVRKYGPDYVDRLRAAGFTVQVTTAGDMVPHHDAVRMALSAASGEIYFCTK
jgi:SAM-dependent methyltransferase